tara:strand:- start:30933 stop:31496 length:564 start_codon:yes stop_codon:yes gene_type:complete
MDKEELSAAPSYSAATNMYTTFPTNKLYEFQFDRYTGGFDANATRENGSTVVNVQLNFYIPKVTAKANKVLDQLAKTCGLIAIVETYADDCGDPDATPNPIPAKTYHFVLGYDEIFKDDSYLDFVSGEETTGIALQDANGAQIALAGDAAMYPIGLNVGTATGELEIVHPTGGGTGPEDAYEVAVVS